MRDLYKVKILSISIVLLGISLIPFDLALATGGNNPCQKLENTYKEIAIKDSNQEKVRQQVVDCANYQIQKRNLHSLYHFASQDNHVGDTGQNNTECIDDLGNNGYFPASKKHPKDKNFTNNYFEQSIKEITFEDCQVSIAKGQKIEDFKNPLQLSRYRCAGTTKGHACAKKGLTTNNVEAIVNGRNGAIISVYPIP